MAAARRARGRAAPPDPGLIPAGLPAGRTARIHPYGLSRDSLERVIRDLRLDARTVNRPESADLIVALRSRAEDARLQRALASRPVPVHVVKRNTTAQIRHLLQNLFHVLHGWDDEEVDEAVREAEVAVQRALLEGVPVELAPRSPTLRQLQHRVVARHHLLAESVGREPRRHLVIRPGG
jgi:hypothetical protein